MEEKKLHIIKNVGFLYLKFGIKGVTMDDVATEFGISKKTLYQYFSDKQDLVTHVVDYFMEAPDRNISSLPETNAINSMFTIRERVVFILKFYNNHIEDDLKKTYPGLYKKVHKAKREKIFNFTVENLNSGIAQGLYRKDIEPILIAKLQVGRMLYTLNPDYKIFEEHEVNSLAFFDNMMSYHMHAVCTKKGLKYYQNQLNGVKNETKN